MNKQENKLSTSLEQLNIFDVNSDEKLTDIQKNHILNILEKIMDKYEKKAFDAEKRNDEKSFIYNSGVVDGLNNSYKVIMGIKDDYLDGINF